MYHNYNKKYRIWNFLIWSFFLIKLYSFPVHLTFPSAPIEHSVLTQAIILVLVAGAIIPGKNINNIKKKDLYKNFKANIFANFQNSTNGKKKNTLNL